MWGNKAEEVSEKGKRVIQILLKAVFAIKKSKVKGPAQEIQFLEIKWQDGCCHVPMDVVNKIAIMSPPARKKERQGFLTLAGFWTMHIPVYSQFVSPLYLVTRKKNCFEWGLEQQQAPIKKEILAAYEGVRSASEVVSTDVYLFLAPQFPMQHWMFKGNSPSTHHATRTTRSKWVALITQ